MHSYCILLTITVNGEKVAGLNIHVFSPMKFFAEILSRCIGHQCSLLTYCKAKNSRENFCGKLKNHENSESLAQRIFPCLRYID